MCQQGRFVAQDQSPILVVGPSPTVADPRLLFQRVANRRLHDPVRVRRLALGRSHCRVGVLVRALLRCRSVQVRRPPGWVWVGSANMAITRLTGLPLSPLWGREVDEADHHRGRRLGTEAALMG